MDGSTTMWERRNAWMELVTIYLWNYFLFLLFYLFLSLLSLSFIIGTLSEGQIRLGGCLSFFACSAFSFSILFFISYILLFSMFFFSKEVDFPSLSWDKYLLFLYCYWEAQKSKVFFSRGRIQLVGKGFVFRGSILSLGRACKPLPTERR